MRNQFIILLTIASVFILIINLVLLATKGINELFFWVVIIIAAVFAYIILPKFKK